jgi:hypothetical protein
MGLYGKGLAGGKEFKQKGQFCDIGKGNGLSIQRRFGRTLTVDPHP